MADSGAGARCSLSTLRPIASTLRTERSAAVAAAPTSPLVDSTIAMAAASLPDIHNDPFDRILAATALVKRLDLLSKDTVLPRYPGLRVIW